MTSVGNELLTFCGKFLFPAVFQTSLHSNNCNSFANFAFVKSNVGNNAKKEE